MKRTALILAAFLLPATVHAGDAAAKESIGYVQKLQTEGGGFVPQAQAPNKPGVPSLRATSAAVRALHYLGGDIKNKDACINFVESCYDPASGGFCDVPRGKPGVFETAVGLMAVAELNMPLEKYADGATKYLAENAKSFEEIRIAAAGFEAIKKKSPRRDDWLREMSKFEPRSPRDARESASITVTFLRLGEKFPKPGAVIKLLNDGQRITGGWGKADDVSASDLETTYRVMRCFMMLKGRPENADAVRAFVAKCRNKDGGCGLAPGRPSTVSGVYFASIITHWLKEMR